MRFLLVVLLFNSCLAALTWEKAPIYQIEKDVFQKKVIDSYEANLKSENPFLASEAQTRYPSWLLIPIVGLENGGLGGPKSSSI